MHTGCACFPPAGRDSIRRALGLYGFLFIGVHLLAYAYGDNDLDTELILPRLEQAARDVGRRNRDFALLIPLALTSTRGWQKRLGRRWKILHRLVYFALPLAVLHYLLLDRDYIELPIIYRGCSRDIVLVAVGSTVDTFRVERTRFDVTRAALTNS